jgi:hypothetical protein
LAGKAGGRPFATAGHARGTARQDAGRSAE